MKKIYIWLAFLLVQLQLLPIQATEIPFQYHAQNAIVMDANSGSILYAKDAQVQISPASMTKIMTAIIVIENTSHFDQKIIVANSDTEGLAEQQISRIGLQPGDEISIEDALYGLMMASGGDCANTLARFTTGYRATFVELMNQKAQALGMKNTHFTNPIGYDEEDHYSTVEDIAILMQYAIQNERFLQYTGAKDQIIQINNQDVQLGSTTYQGFKQNGLKYDDIISAKTGYTLHNGHCLASVAQQNKQRMIVVVADSGTEKENNSHLDTRTLYDYYFEHSQSLPITEELKHQVAIGSLIKKEIPSNLPSEIYLSQDVDKEQVSITYEPRNVLQVTENQTIGTLTVKEQDTIIAQVSIRAKKSAKAWDIYLIAALLILFYLVFFLYQHHRHQLIQMKQKGENRHDTKHKSKK